jgi:hypothetical protein
VLLRRAVDFLRAGLLRAVAFLRPVDFFRAGLLRRAVAFLRPVDLRAVDFFLRAGLLRAVAFLRPVDRRAVDLRAVDFRAGDLRVVLRPVDLLRPVVFFAANPGTSIRSRWIVMIHLLLLRCHASTRSPDYVNALHKRALNE